MKVPANRTNPFNKWQQSFPKRNNSTVQASFDWLAISKQCQNNYMDAWIGIPATLHHDPSHHFLSPAPATGLLQRLRCCSSRLKSSVCDFFLLTLHWFLASSMETPSVIETEWYQLEVKCFDSKKKMFHSHADSGNFAARKGAQASTQWGEKPRECPEERSPSLLVFKVSRHRDVNGQNG